MPKAKLQPQQVNTRTADALTIFTDWLFIMTFINNGIPKRSHIDILS